MASGFVTKSYFGSAGEDIARTRLGVARIDYHHICYLTFDFGGVHYTMDLLVREVSTEDLFNLPLYEHHLVIDTRARREFDAGHVASAVSYPSPCFDDPDCTESDREKSLLAFAQAYASEYLRPENPSPVVLYGQHGNTHCLSHAKWLGKKLKDLQEARKALALVEKTSHTSADNNATTSLSNLNNGRDDRSEETSDDRFDHFEYFCQTVADNAKEVWILDGGYEAFLSEYDFLCGHVEFADMFPLPHQITRQLLLGTRVVPLRRDVLAKLRVSHLVVSEYQRGVEWDQLEGIEVLRCAVHDRNSETMAPCWTACTSFIRQAVTAGGKVLVLLHGRSRSTSVVIAYLMRTQGLDLQASWDLVKSKCWHLIDRSLIYPDQLLQWGRTEQAAIEEA